MELNEDGQAWRHVTSPSPTTIGMPKEHSAHWPSPFSSQQPVSRRPCLSFPRCSSDRICRTIQLGI